MEDYAIALAMRTAGEEKRNAALLKGALDLLNACTIGGIPSESLVPDFRQAQKLLRKLRMLCETSAEAREDAVRDQVG